MTTDHIAIVVKDIRGAVEAFRAAGMDGGEVVRYDEVGMDIAFLGTGENRLELLQAVSENSPVASHPGGLHHVALAVEDIEAAHRRMTEDPRYIVEGEIRAGAHSRIFFFHLTGEEGLYECCEQTRGEK